MKRLLPLALLLAAGCQGNGTGPALAMSFQATRTEPPTGALPPTVISVEGSAVLVSGYFPTPCSSEPIHGSAVRSPASSIRIRIRAERVGRDCAFRPTHYTYEGRIHNLESGSYRVVVEHERDSRRPDGPVVEQTVTIP